MERAIAVDEAASDFGSLRDMNFCIRSFGREGVVAGDPDLWGLDIAMRADGKIDSTITGLDKKTIDHVVTRIGV